MQFSPPDQNHSIGFRTTSSESHSSSVSFAFDDAEDDEEVVSAVNGVMKKRRVSIATSSSSSIENKLILTQSARRRCFSLDASSALLSSPQKETLESFDHESTKNSDTVTPVPATPTPRAQSVPASKMMETRVISIDEALEISDKDAALMRDSACTQCKHPDLKTITPSTLASVLMRVESEKESSLAGEKIDSKKKKRRVLIIDCRYDYEHEGGHIKGAVHGMDPVALHSQLFKAMTCEDKDAAMKNYPILVFHCEFSAHRAPKMMRAIRNMDRKVNAENYPELFYPEMYLLRGGYKDFFAVHPEHCKPCAYTPMSLDEHAAECRRTGAHMRRRWKLFYSQMGGSRLRTSRSCGF